MRLGLDASVVLRLLTGHPPEQADLARRTVLRDSAISQLTRTSAGLTDRLIHADYQSESVATATFDKALGKLPDTLLMK